MNDDCRKVCLHAKDGATNTPTTNTQQINTSQTHTETYTAQVAKSKRNGQHDFGSVDQADFAQSRKEELQGLIDNGTFRPIQRSTIPKGERIYGARFLDEIKKARGQMRKKSRFIAQNYNDLAAATIPTKAPSVQRFSQRIITSVGASVGASKQKRLKGFSRDVTQAYPQAKSSLERPVYIEAPPELGLPDSYVLLVVKPLYGIPESGLHWYITYLEHHLVKLGMIRSVADPCVLIKRNNEELEGVIILQVDDTFGFGTTKFLESEETVSQAFRSKTRTPLTEIPTTFNGLNITKTDKEKHMNQLEKPEIVYQLTQTDKINKLKKVDNEKDYASMRALAQYIGMNVRPDICAPVQLLSLRNATPTLQQCKALNKALSFLQKTAAQGLKFANLDLYTTRLLLLTDSSFANVEGLKSQLGYVILMVESRGYSNIIHYGSNRFQLITRSVMESEIHALVHGFDYTFTMPTLLKEILGEGMMLEAMVDSRTTFNVIAKDGRTVESRLQIDIASLKESYEKGEIWKIAWIPGWLNCADALTKPVFSTSSALYTLMTTNVFAIEQQGWATSRAKKKELECQI